MHAAYGKFMQPMSLLVSTSPCSHCIPVSNTTHATSRSLSCRVRGPSGKTNEWDAKKETPTQCHVRASHERYTVRAFDISCATAAAAADFPFLSFFVGAKMQSILGQHTEKYTPAAWGPREPPVIGFGQLCRLVAITNLWFSVSSISPSSPTRT